MSDFRLAPVQAKFADIIWRHVPIPSPELVKICEKELNWKKPTTYTELRRLCDRGLFKNEKALVTALITRDEFYANHSRQYVTETFGGSLPKFLAAFISGSKLTDKQVQEIERIIKEHAEGGKHD